MTFYIKQNDTSPAWQVTLKDAAGNAVDVTGATVVFSMEDAFGTAKINEAAATIVTAASGVVSYSWSAGDTDTAGDFFGEFEVTYADSTVETFPNSAKGEPVRIVAEIG